MSYDASLILVMSLSVPLNVSINDRFVTLGFVFVYWLALSFTVYDCLKSIFIRAL